MVRVHRCNQSGVQWLIFGEDAIPDTSISSMFYRSHHHDLLPEIIDDTDFLPEFKIDAGTLELSYRCAKDKCNSIRQLL
ncbi:hypothetical protein Y032_0124g1182, partial [Ancylostoma ceylanicum]